MKTTLKLLLVIAILVAGQTVLNAQSNNQSVKTTDNTQQIDDLQADTIVQILVLDDVTAKKFKPIYKRYKSELRELSKKYPMKKLRKAEDASNAQVPQLTDDEIEMNIKNKFAKHRATIDIREKYYTEFRNFLTPRQIQKMYDEEIKLNEREKYHDKKDHDKRDHDKKKSMKHSKKK